MSSALCLNIWIIIIWTPAKDSCHDLLEILFNLGAAAAEKYSTINGVLSVIFNRKLKRADHEVSENGIIEDSHWVEGVGLFLYRKEEY